MRGRAGRILLAGVLGGCLSLAGGCDTVLSGGGDAPPALAEATGRGVEIGNRLRGAEGLHPLRRREDLDRLALTQARHMARTGVLTHLDGEHHTLQQRVLRAGVDWQMVGENVARNRGYDDPARQAFDDWLASPPHRHNLLEPDYRETGFGAVRGPDGYAYLAQIFLLSMPE